MQEEPFSLKTPNAIDVLGARHRWNLTSLAQIGSQNPGSTVWESENTAGLEASDLDPALGRHLLILLTATVYSEQNFISCAHLAHRTLPWRCKGGVGISSSISTVGPWTLGLILLMSHRVNGCDLWGGQYHHGTMDDHPTAVGRWETVAPARTRTVPERNKQTIRTQSKSFLSKQLQC